MPVRFDEVTVDTPGVDVVAATDWDEPESEAGRYIHVGQRVTHAPDTASQRPDRADAPETTATTDLGGVPTLGRVAEGLAVGGVVTVLAGVVGASVPTIALGLAGLAGLALAYLGGRALLVGDRVRLGSVAMVSGVGVAAALVGAFAASNLVPALGPSTVGAGVFMSGFLVYLAVWEYGRRRLCRTTGPATSAAG